MVAPAYHSIAVSLLTGIFAAAALFTLVAAYASVRSRRDWVAPAHFGARLTSGIGLLIAVAAVVTGFAIWPLEAVLNSALMKNKLFTVAMLVLLWGMHFALLSWAGPSLWASPLLRLHALLLAVFGFGANVVSNSIGGDAAGNPSGFEQIPRWLGVETRWTFYLPAWMLWLLVLAGVAMVAGAWLLSPDRARVRGAPPERPDTGRAAAGPDDESQG